MTEPPGQAQDYITANYGVRARRALVDLRTFIALGEELAAQGRTAYDGNIYLRRSAEAIVHRVGEAVTRLPTVLIQAHPEIEFSLAKAMRNRVGHRYQSVDHTLLWQSLAVDLPHMSDQVAALLDLTDHDASGGSAAQDETPAGVTPPGDTGHADPQQPGRSSHEGGWPQ